MTIGPFGDVLDVGHVVGREEDGGPPLGVQPDQQLAEALLGQEVEADRGLVEEQDLGLVEHAGRQLAAHPLAERQVADRHVEEVAGLQQLGQVAHPGLLPSAVEPVDRRQHPVGLAGRQLEPEQ